MIFNKGSIYEGYWKNGTFDGEGRKIWYNGSMYKGKWKEGVQEVLYKKPVPNTFLYRNGDRYSGFLDQNQRNGFGIMKYATGDKFVGQWSNN